MKCSPVIENQLHLTDADVSRGSSIGDRIAAWTSASLAEEDVTTGESSCSEDAAAAAASIMAAAASKGRPFT